MENIIPQKSVTLNTSIRKWIQTLWQSLNKCDCKIYSGESVTDNFRNNIKIIIKITRFYVIKFTKWLMHGK